MKSRKPPRTGPQERVWDIFVRIAHWTIVIAFFVAYFTEDEILTLHVWAGYAIGVVVMLRVAWGVFGSRHARFGDFIYRPSTVVAYLVGLVGFRAKRYVGHSPAGGAMVVALLLALATTVWSGMELYEVEEQAGPLAAIPIGLPSVATLFHLSGGDQAEESDGRQADGEFWEAVHEFLANLVMVLVVLHVAGVVLASIVHRENLARSMVTGLKRPERPE